MKYLNCFAIIHPNLKYYVPLVTQFPNLILTLVNDISVYLEDIEVEVFYPIYEVLKHEKNKDL